MLRHTGHTFVTPEFNFTMYILQNVVRQCTNVADTMHTKTVIAISTLPTHPHYILHFLAEFYINTLPKTNYILRNDNCNKINVRVLSVVAERQKYVGYN